MSAIAGLVRLDRHALESEPAERMVARLGWRGGGDESAYRSPDGRAALAASAALLTNETHDIWLALDGGIVNHRTLRHTLELLGHRFRTTSDAEVALHAYEQWELDFAAHLRGAFALALWDDRRDRLVLARDRLGRKPLFLARHRDRLGFASGMAALLAEMGLPRRLDPTALGQYLTYGVVPAPATLVAGVSLLGAGEMLVADRAAPPRRRLWRGLAPAGGAPALRPLPLDRHAGNLRTLLDCAVADRLDGEARAGVWLGPDPASGALAAIATRLAGAAPPVVAVAAQGDQAAVAELRALAAAAGIEPDMAWVEPAALAAALPAMVECMVSPVASPALPAAWFAAGGLARLRARGILAGTGGAEILLSHPAYGLGCWHRLLAPPRRQRPGVPPALRPDAAALLDLPLPPPLPLAALPDWLADDGAAVIGLDDLALRLADGLAPGLDGLAQAHGLEARLPFLDEALVDYALAVPGRIRAPLLTPRRFLRRVLGDLVPAASVVRPPPPALPLARWLTGPLGEVVAERAARWPLVNRAALDEMLAAHGRDPVHGAALWALLVLAEWCAGLGLDQVAEAADPPELAHSRS